MRLLATLAACVLACGAAAQSVAPVGLTIPGKIAWSSKGTYPAATLPKMCVNGHTATATAAQTKVLMSTSPTAALGTTCSRIDWNWDVIETVSNSYNWPGGFAAYFGALCGSGIQNIFISTYNNGLYAAGGFVFSIVAAGANATAYANFGAALANEAVTLGCPTPVVEVFNEPNLTIWTNSVQWNGYAYGPVLNTYAAASKGAKASVKVIAGAPSPGPGTVPNAWGAGMVGSGTFSNVDAYSLHPYSYNTGTPALTPNPDQMLADIESFSIAMAAQVQGVSQPKPIWITEWGYPWDAFTSSVTQAGLNKQGVYIGWGMLNAIISNVTLGSPGVPYFMVYDLVDDGTDYVATDQNSFGLFFNGSASSGSPITGASPYGIKPAGTAFRSITTAMANATSYTIDFDVTKGAPSIRFDKPGGAAIAIWTQDFTGASKALSLNIGTFSSVTCKDLIGNTVSCPYAAGVLTPSVNSATGPIIATAVR